MGFLDWWRRDPQLDRIEDTLDHIILLLERPQLNLKAEKPIPKSPIKTRKTST